MNENNDNFGLDSIQPLEPVTPIPDAGTNTNVFEIPNFYAEPEVEESNTQYAFTPEEPENTSSSEIPAVENGYSTNTGMFAVDSNSSSVEAPEIEDVYSNYAEIPTIEPEMPNVSSVEMPNVGYTPSYNEMPVNQRSMTNDVNEHPDAKIELHKAMKDEAPVDSNLPREKMDKGTFWLLILLFVGLLAVIIALPYVFDLF